MEALLPSSISPKITTILQSHVYPRFGRVLRALARARSVLLDALGKTRWGARRRRRRNKHHAAITAPRRSNRRRSSGSSTKKKKPPHHLTWSGGLSPAEEALDVKYHVCSCYESAWNAVVVPAPPAGGGGTEYCGYLRWLEEEMPDEVVVLEEDDDDQEEGDADADADGGNEIDRLAEQFIARCRANFLLEKQESYDRRQEMISRSL